MTPEKIKNGLESIKDFNANDMIAPVTVTAQDHGGGGKTRIEMWDGAKWVPQTDWIAAFKDDIAPYVVKSTLRFPLAQPVPVKLIARVAKFRAKEVAERQMGR